MTSTKYFVCPQLSRPAHTLGSEPNALVVHDYKAVDFLPLSFAATILKVSEVYVLAAAVLAWFDMFAGMVDSTNPPLTFSSLACHGPRR